ncbi:MFS transporter [Bradyrhizobium japonicum]|uniref:MFS transporter n=1 Tax=Bradyrhizobium japonicum TaxID=375 RepID=UPI0004629990|nr:MFS transporter [Bradyrhizobium japonicum]
MTSFATSPQTRNPSKWLPSRRTAATPTFEICQTPSADSTEAARRRAGQVPLVPSAASAIVEASAARRLPKWRLIFSVFLPFAAGYFLSYLFRTINTLISEPLSADLGLDAGSLGLLTSVYFLSFGAAQIPIGILLDRFGPRRVQSALLLVAALGAALFGASSGFVSLMLARALIGLGVAAALMAGLKAIVLWFPRERVALMNGYMIMLGALGAVTSTRPAEWLLSSAGWRGIFEVLAITTLAAALLIFLAVPERKIAQQAPPAGLRLEVIFTNRRFWQIAPLSASCVGSAWSLQALWAAPWLTDVEGLNREALVTQLFAMTVGICVGAWLLGTIADRLRRRGIGSETLLALVALSFVLAELALILRLPVPSMLPWSVVSVVGAATVLSYATIAEYFPTELAARANGCLNLLHFGWAFAIQSGTGFILQQWPVQDGHYPLIAYQVAFGLSVAVQAAALAWFSVPWIRELGGWIVRTLLHHRSGHEDAVEAIIPPIEISIMEAHECAEW